MLRLFLLIGIILKYLTLYIFIKFNLMKVSGPKVLRAFFEEAGGSFIKFGQLLSLRLDVLSKEYTIELLNLLDNVKPFSYQDVKMIFIDELGATPDKIFNNFEEKPFASASFGQVHAARLPDGTAVAIKVMRPSIETDVLIDFIFIDMLAFVADLFFKIEAMPWKEFAREFKQWTRDELDYRKEADHAEMFYNVLKNNGLKVPKIFRRLSTRRIITQEHLEGITLSHLLRGLRDGTITSQKLMESGTDIKNIPSMITAEILKQYFFLGIFHADPHPGNIIILKNGKVGLVDFGLIGKSLSHQKKSFVRWLKNGMENKLEQSIYYFGQLTTYELRQMIISALPATVTERSIDDFFLMLSKYLTERLTNIINESFESENLKNMKTSYSAFLLRALKTGETFKVKIPREMALYVRVLAIIELVGKEINREFKIEEVFRQFFTKYPESTLVKDDTLLPIRRIGREEALEKLNNWLTHLFEREPKLYSLVENYITQYNSPVN